MSAADASGANGQEEAAPGGFLGWIERAGNKVPHPVIIFLYLIVGVIVLSAILALFKVGITEQILVPAPVTVETGMSIAGGTYAPIEEPTALTPDGEGFVDAFPHDYVLKEVRVDVRSLLTVEGIRFIFTSFVNNFAGFTVVATIFVAMIGVGVAEQVGMMGALIRKMVAVTPGAWLTFVIILVGGLSSIATDAGYLILIPLGAAAFLSVGRHPVAGVAAAYAGVSASFAVNILIAPLDALLTEMTNEAIALVDPNSSITITANWYFSTVSLLVMAVVMTFVTARIIEPRLGIYKPQESLGHAAGEATDMPTPDDGETVDAEAEGRGLRGALIGFLIGVAIVVVFTAPPGAPLRDPATGDIVGTTPFMNSLIFIISMLFLLAGIGYGRAAGTIKSSVDIVNGVTKTFAGLAGLVFMLLVISQFIAYFNFSNLPDVIAGSLAQALQRASVPDIILLILLILVVAVVDIIMTGALPKWAILAPIFIPLFMRLGIAPQTVLAAYRVGDSPLNVITPLMVYLPFVVLVTQRYMKKAGLGTIVALMIPYTGFVLVTWIILFIIWFVLGIPLGPGYPVGLG
ncbi:MAG: AbgT family transporter [Thermomicrobiales bacterium]|nr:AbgT family transporter [Thermomicrobiales bacterium]